MPVMEGEQSSMTQTTKSSSTIEKINFSEFLQDFEETLRDQFRREGDINKLSLKRGLSPAIWKAIMANAPLSVAIPTLYGGRGGSVKECLGLMAAASYESLPLSLTFGINIALFLEPLSKYGNEGIKQEIFNRFLTDQNMGGLMITEPEYGSDALNMKTSHKELKDHYHLKGIKHWQGLTGLADYWIIASRKELPTGELNRDIEFFVCDVTQPGQEIEVEEYFDSIGLYMIPYGRNKLNLKIPKRFKLEPESTGIKMMLDILHRSRMQFPGMGMGFIKRMLDESIAHCQHRVVGGNNLLALDQVQFQISRIQSAYTICSAMCSRSSEISGIDHNLASRGLEANSMKALVADLMQESSQLLAQMSGAKGYRISHIGGRGVMDSRPFQVFEGSNEMLYSQIADSVFREMKKQKRLNLLDYVKNHPLTGKVSDHFRKELNFIVDAIVPQRNLVDLGKILARVISVGYVRDLYEKGFRKDLVDNCITTVQQEVAALVSTFKFANSNKVIYDYEENSSWLHYS